MPRAFTPVVLAAVVAACSQSAEPVQAGAVTVAKLDSATTRASEVVATRRVYFAHQSVGTNVVTGLERMARDQAIGVNTVLTRNPALLTSAPAFVHFLAGKNGDPDSKNADFLRLLDSRRAPDNSIAMLKYCYIDAESPQTAEQIFANYQRTIATIRERHPDVRIVHVTMPLTTVQVGTRATIKRLIGRIEDNRAVAVKRHQYNQLLRSAYATREPVFDIAELESRRSDGTLSYFVANGDTIPTLARELTWDGGHLNDRGQRLAAERLLTVLAQAAGAP